MREDICLVVDTSLFGVNVALIQVNQETNRVEQLFHSFSTEIGKSASQLTMIVQSELKKCNIEITHIKKIAIANGPGSFTGIKIGLAWCYGLKAANNHVQFETYNSLKEICCNLRNKKETNPIVFLKSTKTHGYFSYFNGQEVVCHLIHIHSKDQIGELFAGDSERPIEFVSLRSWDTLEESLKGFNYRLTSLAEEEFMSLAINSCISLFGSKFESLWQKDTLPQPNYMREPTVIEKLTQKKSGNE